MEARIGRPMGVEGGMNREVDNPQYATAVGLALYGIPDGAVHAGFAPGGDGLWGKIKTGFTKVMHEL